MECTSCGFQFYGKSDLPVMLLSVPVRDDALAQLICALTESRAEVVDRRRSLFAEPFERIDHARDGTVSAAFAQALVMRTARNNYRSSGSTRHLLTVASDVIK